MRRIHRGIVIAGFLLGMLLQFNQTVTAQEVTAQEVDQRLDQILDLWENKTAGVLKLTGKYRRYTYDSVFEVETRGDGVFFYEAPDKGRIDLTGTEIQEGEVSERLSRKSGKPYELRADIDEKWVCDGKTLAQGMVQQKVYAMHNIPPEDRGRNIMDSPLPFLFGLPAAKAKARYQMVINPNTDKYPTQVWLDIKPLRKIDMDQWKTASVILDRNTFLPLAVKLIDASGNRETVYAFTEMKPNKPDNLIITIFGGDPFNYKRVFAGYKPVINNGAPVVQAEDAPGRALKPLDTREMPERANPGTQVTPVNQVKLQMPDCTNFDFKAVKKTFEEKGFTVEFRRAQPAKTKDEVFKVASQEPKPGAELVAGQKVVFFLFDEIAAPK